MRTFFTDKKISFLFNGYCIFIILMAIYTCISMLLTNRSLWYDEAMLAYSITNRTLSNLTSTPLDYMQSAPVIYLYITKIITVIAGNSEITLRIWSLLMYIIVLGLSFYLSKVVLNTKYPLVPVAFIANIAGFMEYATEFKPYMTDVACILFILVLYYLYNTRKINIYLLFIIFAILLWLSNPSAFFIIAIILWNSVELFIKKEYKRIIPYIIGGFIVLFSFIVYYYYWLKPVIDAGGMTEFWKEQNFILIPTSKDQIYAMSFQIKSLLYPIPYYKFLVIVVLGGMLLNITSEKNKIINIIFIGLLITFITSHFGRYPISYRLYLFLVPIISILFFFYINKLYTSDIKKNIIIILISVAILSATSGISTYAYKENRYKQELNLAIDYLNKVIKKEDKIYVYVSSVPAYQYRYKSSMNNENVTFLGKKTFRDNREDIALILQNEPIYILTTHVNKHSLDFAPLLDSLKTRGNLDTVYNEYGAEIYYYTNSINETAQK